MSRDSVWDEQWGLTARVWPIFQPVPAVIVWDAPDGTLSRELMPPRRDPSRGTRQVRTTSQDRMDYLQQDYCHQRAEVEAPEGRQHPANGAENRLGHLARAPDKCSLTRGVGLNFPDRGMTKDRIIRARMAMNMRLKTQPMTVSRQVFQKRLPLSLAQPDGLQVGRVDGVDQQPRGHRPVPTPVIPRRWCLRGRPPCPSVRPDACRFPSPGGHCRKPFAATRVRAMSRGSPTYTPASINASMNMKT